MPVQVLEARGSAGQAASANALRLLLEGSTQAVRSAAGGWVDGWLISIRPAQLFPVSIAPIPLYTPLNRVPDGLATHSLSGTGGTKCP